MGEVQARILQFHRDAGGSASPRGGLLSCATAASTPNLRLRTSTGGTSAGDFGEAWPGRRGTRSCLPRVPFRPAVLVTVAICVLTTGCLMYVPLEVFSGELESATLEAFESSVESQVSTMRAFTDKAAEWFYGATLQSIGGNISRSVVLPCDHAVDVLWGAMRVQQRLDPAFRAHEPGWRPLLQLQALLELQGQHATGVSRANHLYAGFAGDQIAGAILLEEDAAELMDAGGGAGPLNISFTRVDPSTLEPINVTWEGWDGPTQRPWYRLQGELSEEFPDGQPRRAWSRLYAFVNGELGLTLTSPVAYCGNYSCFEGVVAADITLPILNDICRTAWDDLRNSAFDFDFTPDNSAVFVVNRVSRRFPEQEGLLVGESAVNAQGLVDATDSHNAVIRRTSEALLRRFQNWSSPGLSQDQFFTFDENFNSCVHGSDCIQGSSSSIALDNDTEWLVVVVSPVEAFSAMPVETRRRGHEEIEAMADLINEKHHQIRFLAGVVFIVTTLLSIGVGFCLTMMVSAPLRQLGRLMQGLSRLDFAEESGDLGRLMSGRRALIADVSELQDAFCRLSGALETFSRFVPEPVVRNIVRGDERGARLHVDKRVVTIMFSDIRGFTSISEALPLKDLVFMLTLYLSTMMRIVESYGGVVAEILGDGLLIFWNSGHVTDEDHERQACGAALAMQEALGPLNSDLSSIGLPQLSVRIGVHTGEVLCGNIGSDMKMKFGCMGDPVNLASRLEGLCNTYGVGIICSGDTHSALTPASGIVTRRLDLAQVKGRSEAVHLFEVMGEDLVEAVGDSNDVVGKVASHDSCGSRTMVHCRSTAAGAEAASSGVAEVLQGAQRLSHIAEMRDRASRLAETRRRGAEPGGRAGGAGAEGPGVSTREKRAQSRRYEQALDAYQRAEFARARDLAQALSDDYPADMAAAWLLERARRYLGGPCGSQVVGISSQELASWTGVSIMTDK